MNGKLRIGIVGAGKMGCALGMALNDKGYKIGGVHSRSKSSAEFLCNKIGIKSSNPLNKVIEHSDVIFITVSDNNLRKISREISENIEKEIIEGKMFLHCSGAITSDALNYLTYKGGVVGSLHPIQTFADKENGWKGLRNIYFGYEGCNDLRNNAEKLVKALDSKLIFIKKEDKPLYHAAACIMSNYLVTLSYITDNIFKKIGAEEGEGIKALAPLLLKTTDNIISLGPKNALTGPVSRGDFKTIENHIKNIEDNMKEILKVYKSLGILTTGLALEKGTISINEANKLNEVLKE